MAEALEVWTVCCACGNLLVPSSRLVSSQVSCLQDNIFEWHFAVRGAPDTPFQVCCTPEPVHLLFALALTPADSSSSWPALLQGGIYHGRILLPAEYPFKPPR